MPATTSPSSAPGSTSSSCRCSRVDRRLKRLQELDQRHPIGVAEVGAVGMAGVRVARQSRVEQEGPDKGTAGFDADMPGVEFPAADEEYPRSLRDRLQQVIERRDRAVVEIGSRRPDAVERPGAIGLQATELVRLALVDLLLDPGIGLGLLGPLLDDAAAD